MYRTARPHPPSFCQVSFLLTLHLAPDLTGTQCACLFVCLVCFLCTPAQTHARTSYTQISHSMPEDGVCNFFFSFALNTTWTQYFLTQHTDDMASVVTVQKEVKVKFALLDINSISAMPPPQSHHYYLLIVAMIWGWHPASPCSFRQPNTVLILNIRLLQFSQTGPFVCIKLKQLLLSRHVSGCDPDGLCLLLSHCLSLISFLNCKINLHQASLQLDR